MGCLRGWPRALPTTRTLRANSAGGLGYCRNSSPCPFCYHPSLGYWENWILAWVRVSAVTVRLQPTSRHSAVGPPVAANDVGPGAQNFGSGNEDRWLS